MLSITFKTNVLSFFSSQQMKTPLVSHVLLLYLLLLRSSFSFYLLLLVQFRPTPPATSHGCPISSPPPSSLPTATLFHPLHYLTFFLLYHFLTRLPHLSLSQPHLLDIPALFSCSLQHNFLTHFLSPPWPPDQSLQDGIALGSGEGEREMGG